MLQKIIFDHCDRVKFRFRVFAKSTIKESEYCEHINVPFLPPCKSKIVTKKFKTDIFENESKLNKEENYECVIRTNEIIKVMDHLSSDQKRRNNQNKQKDKCSFIKMSDLPLPSTKTFSKNII